MEAVYEMSSSSSTRVDQFMVYDHDLKVVQNYEEIMYELKLKKIATVFVYPEEYPQLEPTDFSRRTIDPDY